jgi:hypothetical protein
MGVPEDRDLDLAAGHGLLDDYPFVVIEGQPYGPFELADGLGLRDAD